MRRLFKFVLLGSGACIVLVFSLVVLCGIIAAFTNDEQGPLKTALAKAKTPEERADLERRWKEMSEARAKVHARERANAEAEAKAREKSKAVAQSEEQLAVELIEFSKRAVKEKLKSPGTAKFPGTVFGRNEFKLYTMRDGSYRVFSWVDAQNSFGATLRSQWAVTLKKTGERWEILNVTVE
jgi:hypothetical protein